MAGPGVPRGSPPGLAAALLAAAPPVAAAAARLTRRCCGGVTGELSPTQLPPVNCAGEGLAPAPALPGAPGDLPGVGASAAATVCPGGDAAAAAAAALLGWRALVLALALPMRLPVLPLLHRGVAIGLGASHCATSSHACCTGLVAVNGADRASSGLLVALHCTSAPPARGAGCAALLLLTVALALRRLLPAAAPGCRPLAGVTAGRPDRRRLAAAALAPVPAATAAGALPPTLPDSRRLTPLALLMLMPPPLAAASGERSASPHDVLLALRAPGLLSLRLL